GQEHLGAVRRMSELNVEGVTRLRVRYGETDQMGFVYHPNYLVWCEIGRTELLRDLGYAYVDMERKGFRLAVAEASLRYARSAHYDDAIRVVTRLAEARSRTITFHYEIHRECDSTTELLATATTRLIALDESGTPRRLPQDLLERFRDTPATA
ncbi:MAG TPA: thioesterase family protein, partial [Longimicrobiales bacterium]|nr:thioesterase family protein [Longimicrobiales bacterium]